MRGGLFVVLVVVVEGWLCTPQTRIPSSFSKFPFFPDTPSILECGWDVRRAPRARMMGRLWNDTGPSVMRSPKAKARGDSVRSGDGAKCRPGPSPGPGGGGHIPSRPVCTGAPELWWETTHNSAGIPPRKITPL